MVDSRPAEEGRAIRRRRECDACGHRFTTFERAEAIDLVVLKRDGSKDPYSRQKVVAGIQKAITNRPVSGDDVSRLADRVEERLRRKGPEVTSQDVGLEVLSGLKKIDAVAYLRFASVYKDFQEVGDFEREVGLLLQKRQPKRRGTRP